MKILEASSSMQKLKEETIQCPYCWEMIDILIDCSVEEQQYIEDCQVCCRPINMRVMVNEDLAAVYVSSEDD